MDEVLDVATEVELEAYEGSEFHDRLQRARLVYTLYDLVFVRGVLLLSRAAAWFDQHVIDGIVNLSAVTVREISRLGGFLDDLVVDGAVNAVANATYAVGGRVRRIQTGAINAYLYVVVLGVLGGVFLWWSWASAS